MVRIYRDNLGSNIPLIFLIGIGTVVLIWKVFIVHLLQHVGYGDSAGYATMASSLSRGEGLSVGYISSFFEKYQNIVRPEDHWPPLYSFLIAPLFWLFGDSVFLAKVPTILVSTFGLPLVSYWLTQSFGGSRWASLGSGLTILLYPILFMESLVALTDISYTFVFCLAVLFFVKGSKQAKGRTHTSQSADRKWFLLMGLLLGISYYGKGIALIMYPVFFVSYMFVTKRLKFNSSDKNFLFGMLVAVSMVTPWWVRNYILFDDPFFSTQNYMSGLQGYGEGNGLYVYWDSEVKPSFFTTKLGLGISCVIDKSRNHISQYFQLIFVANYPRLGISHYLGERWGTEILVFGIPGLIGFLFFWRNRVVSIIPLVVFTSMVFLSVFWSPISRLAFPSMLLVTALGWSVWSILLNKICEWFSQRLPRKKRTDAVFLSNLILVVMGIAVVVDNVTANYVIWREATEENIYPYAENNETNDRLNVARWINENTTEDAVIMDYEPWDLHFHSKRRTVSIPYESLEKINEVIQEYDVTYLTFYHRRSLSPLFTGEVEGLELVYYPGIYKKYVEKYPDLVISAQKSIDKTLEKGVALEAWGKAHYEATGKEEKRTLPKHSEKEERNGLVVWKITDEYWKNNKFRKTINIEWNYDVCR